MPEGVIYELLLILAGGLIAGLVCRAWKIPTLVGYLVVGATLGDSVLGWVQSDTPEIKYLAEAGVFLLLFSIGLQFSLDGLLRIGRNMLIGGSVQMLLVAVPVAVVLQVSGVASSADAVLVAAAVALSSTVLVFKSLAESGQTSTAPGKRAIGILLFQDAALVPLLLLVPLLTGTGQAPGVLQYAQLAIVSIAMIVAVVAFRKLLAGVIPLLTSYRSPDLVVLFALVVLGTVTLGAYTLGLPPAVGAFAAGLVCGGNRWSAQVEALTLPFRETFAMIFFVSLGLLKDVGLLVEEPLFILSGVAAIILLKSIASTIALRLTGLPWKPAAGLGLGLAHVGEFAFVLLLLGQESGLIAEDLHHRIVTIALGTLILTPLLMRWGARWIVHGRFAEDEPHDVFAPDSLGMATALVVGLGPVGRTAASRLETLGREVHLIDLSPINLHDFAQQGFRTVAGDATEPSVLEAVDADSVDLAVLCVPDDAIALRVLRQLRRINPKCFILVRCRFDASEAELRETGADHVISEERQAALEFVRALTEREESS